MSDTKHFITGGGTNRKVPKNRFLDIFRTFCGVFRKREIKDIFVTLSGFSVFLPCLVHICYCRFIPFHGRDLV